MILLKCDNRALHLRTVHAICNDRLVSDRPITIRDEGSLCITYAIAAFA